MLILTQNNIDNNPTDQVIANNTHLLNLTICNDIDPCPVSAGVWTVSGPRVPDLGDCSTLIPVQRLCCSPPATPAKASSKLVAGPAAPTRTTPRNIDQQL